MGFRNLNDGLISLELQDNASWNGLRDSKVSLIANNINYSVTGAGSDGCVGTDQVSVSVYPLPNVNAGADQSICDGSSVTLFGTGAGTPGPYNFNGTSDSIRHWWNLYLE